jgi:type IV pilus assembly protein PilP
VTAMYKTGAWVFTALLLSGCMPSGNDELVQWMGEQKANAKSRVTPLTEPKKFAPQAYAVEASLDPFNQSKLTLALRRESNQVASNASLIAPETSRRKEPLEGFPLDAMAMVGSLNKTGAPAALLRVDNLIYQVRVGNYLGQNYGKILKITETQIQLREIVQDATGDWTERISSLDLQEGKK